jgi:UDP-N-acetylglucosamine 2-epimerase
MPIAYGSSLALFGRRIVAAGYEGQRLKPEQDFCMRIVTVVGARPQFIKAGPVCKALKANHIDEYLVHTGQHYDQNMSDVFFAELGIPAPNINLGVGSSSHGQQTGEMLIKIEQVLLEQKPDWLLVYGDTNSTIAGALAAVKLHIPVAHVEAGLRSFNRQMPEEHNRVLTDHCSDLLFCPSQSAVAQLHREGITRGVHFIGDVMYDAVLQCSALASVQSIVLQRLNLQSKQYCLATVHRPANTDNTKNLQTILDAFSELKLPVIFPVHPRTRQKIANLGLSAASNVHLIAPIGYLDMLHLQRHARIILTDSGGIQKEAYWLGVPCVTLRDETEWVETVEAGANVLTGANKDAILAASEHFCQTVLFTPAPVYGDGQSADKIAALLLAAENA